TGWSAAERLALNGMLGLGALSLRVPPGGIAALNARGGALVLALASVRARRQVGGWLREARGWLRGSLPASGWERTLARFAVVLLALALPLATLPPARWDTLTYHLAGPQTYVAEGRFFAAPHNHFLGFPQLVDTLYAAQL